MQHVERLSITLPSEMAQLIRSKVEAGSYASNSEVIREAMRVWQTEDTLRSERVARVRAKIAEADADTRPSLSEEDVDSHFLARKQGSKSHA